MKTSVRGGSSQEALGEPGCSLSLWGEGLGAWLGLAEGQGDICEGGR